MDEGGTRRKGEKWKNGLRSREEIPGGIERVYWVRIPILNHL